MRLSYGQILLFYLCFISAASAALPTGTSHSDDKRVSPPNVLLVVADDLGLFDIGAFGGEIRTPTLDRLAERGVRFTNFYTSATCSPSRAMLLTGADSHVSGLGNMAEHSAPNQIGLPGYEGVLSDRVVTVASLLQGAGYRTFMAGKWHLGREARQLPVNRGFDESIALLQGGATYFNEMRGLAEQRPFALYARNEDVVEQLPDDFYATEHYADFIIEQIDATKESGAPFFAYLAFTAPHWPFQLKAQHLDLYKGRYASGYDELFQQRLSSAENLGILPKNIRPAVRPTHIPLWTSLTHEEQRVRARSMELYAGLVERMDFHLGRVLTYLEQSGEMTNTVVVFLSDNGAEGRDLLKNPARRDWLQENWDLSYSNMGRRGSYVFQGPGWARASTGPYRLFKNFVSEGGIRAPLIISAPGQNNPGALVHSFTTVKDVAPTVLEWTGVLPPKERFNGRPVAPMEGQSLRTMLANPSAAPHGEEYGEERIVGWELFGHRAIRKGHWKLIWLSSKPRWHHVPDLADQWGLYNLAADPGEVNNRINSNPQKFLEMLELWQVYVEEQGVVLPQWN